MTKNKKKFLDNAKALTVKLHKLGTQSESKEAENIRDELDSLWYLLSEAERKELSSFSASLKTIN